MTGKEFLDQIREYRLQIRTLTEKRREIMTRLYSATSPSLTGGISGNVYTDRIPDGLAKADEVLEKIMDIYEIFLEMIEQAKNEMDPLASMDKGRYYQVLMLRYICGDAWTDIAKMAELNPRYVFRLHRQALQAYEDFHVPGEYG